MRILINDHSCAVEINQRKYLVLARQYSDLELKILLPEVWRSQLSVKAFRYTRNLELSDSLVPASVFFIGSCNKYLFKAKLLQTFRSFRPDITFINSEPWTFSAIQVFALAKLFGTKIVIYTHETSLHKLRFPLPLIESIISPRLDAAIAISEDAAKRLRNKGCGAQITVIPHPIDLASFKKKDAGNLREKLHLSNFVIGYIGRFVAEKGLSHLLRAARLLKDSRITDFSLLLVGDGPTRPKVESLIRELDLLEEARLTGYVPHHQAADYINCMSVMVLPSITTPHWKEQFGRTIVESMACGVPVVGSNSGEIPKLVEANGGGLIFREADAEDLKGKLQTLYLNHRLLSHLGDVGSQSVIRSYSYSRVARDMYEVFCQVLKNECKSEGSQ